MRLFKFMFYGFAFLIGLTIAFCSNTNYDQNSAYTYPDVATPIIDSYPDFPKSEYSEGKHLFKRNCAACHNRNMQDDMTGPALKGTKERWKGREELLYQWIRNSQAVVASGDEYAIQLYNDWNKSVMTAFPNLKDEDIKALLDYIESVP